MIVRELTAYFDQRFNKLCSNVDFQQLTTNLEIKLDSLNSKLDTATAGQVAIANRELECLQLNLSQPDAEPSPERLQTTKKPSTDVGPLQPTCLHFELCATQDAVIQTCGEWLPLIDESCDCMDGRRDAQSQFNGVDVDENLQCLLSSQDVSNATKS